MYRSERSDKILDLLGSKKHLSIQALCDALYCSVSTVRRDLIELEKAGLIKRSHGEASIVAGANIEYSSSFRETEHVREKSYICSLAVDFLSNGMALFLDSSSTAMNLCPILEQYNNITVVTNSIRTAFCLNESDRVDAFLTGGYLKKGASATIGELAVNTIDQFKADLAVISCRGIDASGAYEANQEQAWVKQHMIRNSKSTILLCDSSKFEQSYFYKLSSYQSISAVLTERKPPEEMLREITACGCEVLY